MSNVAIGVRYVLGGRRLSLRSCQIGIFAFTLFIYTIFHASRKPIGVVKSVLHPNCTEIAQRENKTITPQNATFCMWKPFDGDNYNVIFGFLDFGYLMAYAIGMFISGHLAERMNLRVFLTIGCLLSGISTAAFGIGYFLGVHALPFYVIVQVVAGLVQACGWPAVVTCMGNWFGKGRRGFILGVWNSHVSLGNILGSLLAGAFVEIAWGWSFVVPGLLLCGLSLLVFLFLVPYPEDLGLAPPDGGTAQLPVPAPDDYPSESDALLSSTLDKGGRVEQSETVPQVATVDSGSSGAGLTSTSREQTAAITICGALKVPGVIEYSLCLFFVKSVAYTFLFWLPKYIKEAEHLDAGLAADLSAVFDVGGILGGMVAGLVVDRTESSALVCLVMILTSMPILGTYYAFGAASLTGCIVLLLLLGFFIVGPYSLITTAVATDLGTHESLRGNAKALATVTAIIDGTGSIGAAVGPWIVGLIVDRGWFYIFVMLISFLGVSALFLLRPIIKESRFCRSTAIRYVPLS